MAAKVELLFFAGCPHYPELARSLGEELRELDACLELVEVRDAEMAAELHFLGSPTVRVDGLDVDRNAQPRTDYRLSCRLYRTPEGVSPVPPREWVRTAVRRAQS